MNSIRQRIVLPLLACLAVILAAGGSGVYFFTRALLTRDFDLMLRSVVPEVVGAVRGQLVERFAEGKELQFGLSEALAKSAVYVEAWTPEGRVLGRSASLQGADLQFPSPLPKASVLWRDEILTNRHPARALVFAFNPPTEEREARIKNQSRGQGDAAAAMEGANREKLAMEARLLSLPQSMVVVIARDRSEMDGTLQRLSLVLWLAGALMLLLTTLVVTFVGRRGLAPLEQVGEQAGRIDASKLDFRFPTKDLPVELGSICERLNDLLSRLEAAFARERRFSADVAHELRTPITELRSLAEIALKWPAFDPVVAAAFQDTLEAALQMQGIVDGLLAIARCEAGTQTIVREPVDMAELARKTWQPFEARAARAGLAVELELPDRALVETDRIMVGLILINLFSNVVEYTPRQGAVQIQLHANGSGIDFRVANQVENVAPEDLPHFFERFWRQDTARSSSEHSGIGLSVSQAYAGKLGLELTATMPREGWLAMRLSRNTARIQ